MNRRDGQSGAIGIFGGTFDPVHFGHLRAAVEAREKLALEDFRLLPAGDPPHRSDTVATAAQRLEMLRLATAACAGLQVDDREIRRPGASYMADTLEGLRRECATAPLMLLIGQDAANGLDRWHRWRELFELAHLVVMRRPDAHFECTGELRQQIQRRRVSGPEDLHLSPAGCVLALQVTQLDISSTAIRRMLADGRSADFLLPGSVLAYIHDKGLYRGG